MANTQTHNNTHALGLIWTINGPQLIGFLAWFIRTNSVTIACHTLNKFNLTVLWQQSNNTDEQLFRMWQTPSVTGKRGSFAAD